ncbi:Myb/SANT-like DNA-binding domain protein [Rhynchospora pubera]|uniref:Myb/SANT-like DNA-binding domain protein n=1 Tax=Rhynchospora pubera TaxID=906938 RepID=A0AAV8G542_9POAL|nr:Myb/SANT-like DNA-binding domain protein [Rhynchospora pubera]
MGRKRSSSSSTSTVSGGKGESLVWSEAMDTILINAFVHQQDIGNRVNGTFTTHAYENIVNELKVAFPDKPVDKAKVMNRMKYIKKGFGSCYDLFRNLSGFSWSPVTNMWSADDPGVWDKLIESHPEAANWMNKPIMHYKSLEKLYGQDRANGENAETPSEIRQRLAQQSNDTEGEGIAAIDRMVAHNEATLEDLNNENTGSPDGNKRHKFTREEVQAEIMKGIQGVAEAIVRSTEVLVNAQNSQTEQLVKAQSSHTEQLVKAQTSKLSMPAAEIWTRVVELDLDPSKRACI